jgi:hypothetical protein
LSVSKSGKIVTNFVTTKAGSAKANGRETKSYFGQVYKFKLGCFVMGTIARPTQARLSPEWKTQPRFCPASLSLSTAKVANTSQFPKRVRSVTESA